MLSQSTFYHLCQSAAKVSDCLQKCHKRNPMRNIYTVHTRPNSIKHNILKIIMQGLKSNTTALESDGKQKEVVVITFKKIVFDAI